MYWMQGKHCGSWVWVFLWLFVSLKLIFIVLSIFNLFLHIILIRGGVCATGREQPQGRKVTLAGPKSDIGRAEKSHKGQNVTLECYNAVCGPQSRVDGCHVGALGQQEGPPVCVPAIQDGPSSSAEERLVIRRQGDSDCSTATGSVMVSGVDGSDTGRSNPAVHRGSRSADSRRFDRRRKLITTGHQIYTRGNSTGHPEGQGPFQGSCSHDVKVPSSVITPGVWIP